MLQTERSASRVGPGHPGLNPRLTTRVLVLFFSDRQHIYQQRSMCGNFVNFENLSALFLGCVYRDIVTCSFYINELYTHTQTHFYKGCHLFYIKAQKYAILFSHG